MIRCVFLLLLLLARSLVPVESELHENQVLLKDLAEKLEYLEVKVQDQSLEINKLRNKVHRANKNIESILQQLGGRKASSSDDAIFRRLKRTTSKSKVKSNSNILTDQMNKAAMNSHQSVKIQYRSCHEIFTAHTGGVLSSLANNRQVFNTFIDPDGLGIGDPPIFVECDMSNNGTTKVIALTDTFDGHDFVLDSATNITVSNCTDPGCSVHEIDYGHASMRQLLALSAISHQCHQFIRYDCLGALMQHDGVHYAFWNDRKGVPRYFWAGNETEQAVCQCGIDKSCINPRKNCNCDSLDIDSNSRFDEGLITDKNLLPITRLNFGRITKSGLNGRFTLGPFECTGRHYSILEKILPANCKDVFHLGHIHNGYYIVSNISGDDADENKDKSKKISLIYCDFNQISFEDKDTEEYDIIMSLDQVQMITNHQIDTRIQNMESKMMNRINDRLKYQTELLNKMEMNLREIGDRMTQHIDNSLDTGISEQKVDSIWSKALQHFKFADGTNLLMFVCQYYDNPKLIEVIRLLISSGVDINVKSNRNWNVLHTVCAYYSRDNLIDIVRLLIQSGVDVKSKTEDNWNALLLVSNYYSGENLVDIVRLLIESGVDVGAKTSDNWNVLHILCHYYSHENLIEILRILIQNGADVKAKTNDGYSALQLLNYNNKVPHKISIIDLFVKHGSSAH